MPKREITYKKLPGRGLRREGFITFARTYCTLWLANDHILSIDHRVFSESYRRFYFRDIQAMIIQRTNRGKVWNIILAVLTGLSALIAMRVGEYATVSWVIISGILGVLLFVNWLRGPTCKCHILTAVQREILPSLGRLKTAEKVTPSLKRLIEKTQGQLNLEEIQGQ